MLDWYTVHLRFVCFTGGLADEVTEDVLRNAFIPFGDLVDIQIPLDYETEKHRGFAFIEFELPEDAVAAIDNMVSWHLIMKVFMTILFFLNLTVTA